MRSDKDWLIQAWHSENTRVLIVKDHQIPVTDDLSLVWVHPESIDLPVEELVHHAVLLGVQEDVIYVALVDDSAHAIELNDDESIIWAHLRDVGAQLSTHDVGLAVTAIAMSQWHQTHTHCPRCGSRTQVIQAGWARHCDLDQSEHYPRTEPAMIVAVTDASDRLLLGRRAGWPDGWFSTLAGFVEAGESAEACVVREVFEESGVVVSADSLRYLGSQPWPYPASLMLGYRAVARETEIVCDEEEMAQVKWFTRAEFISACQTRELKVPNRGTIAWHLIADWYGEEIPNEWSR